jgi:hypothetical protein
MVRWIVRGHNVVAALPIGSAQQLHLDPIADCDRRIEVREL